MNNKIGVFGILIALTLSSFMLNSNELKKEYEWNYSVECRSAGQVGNYNLYVRSMISNKENSNNEANKISKRHAVHAVLFRGVSGDNTQNCINQKPLIDNPLDYKKHQEFFDEFFFGNNGLVDRFVTITENPDDPSSIIKVRGEGWRVGRFAVVKKDDLRKFIREQLD